MSETIELERLSETLKVLRRSRYHLDLGIASVEADMAALSRKKDVRRQATLDALMARGVEEGDFEKAVQEEKDFRAHGL